MVGSLSEGIGKSWGWRVAAIGFGVAIVGEAMTRFVSFEQRRAQEQNSGIGDRGETVGHDTSEGWLDDIEAGEE